MLHLRLGSDLAVFLGGGVNVLVMNVLRTSSSSIVGVCRTAGSRRQGSCIDGDYSGYGVGKGEVGLNPVAVLYHFVRDPDYSAKNAKKIK